MYSLDYTPEMQAQYDEYLRTGQMPANTGGMTQNVWDALGPGGPMPTVGPNPTAETIDQNWLPMTSTNYTPGAINSAIPSSGTYTNFAAQLEALRNGVPSAQVFAQGMAGGTFQPTPGQNMGQSLESMYAHWGVDPNVNTFQGQLDKAFGVGNSPFLTYDQQMTNAQQPGAVGTRGATHLIRDPATGQNVPAPGTYGSANPGTYGMGTNGTAAARSQPELNQTVNQLSSNGQPWAAGSTSAIPNFNGYTPTNGWNGRPSQGWDGWLGSQGGQGQQGRRGRPQRGGLANTDLHRAVQRTKY